jgi:UDP-N-acetylmuramate--alanine ligase
VYTPAIPKDHIEFNYLKDNGFTLMKRSQVLGLLTENMFTVGVAGTHGKTTTSSIVTHVLKAAGRNVTAFLGGITQNYGTNFLLNNGPENIICVVEADEFDRSFLTLAPNLAIVTSTDADHLDIYGDHSHVLESFQLYVNKLKPGGKAFIQADQSLTTLAHASQSSYGLNQGQIQASNIRIENATFIFDIVHPQGTIQDINMLVPGFHNVENAVAAAAVCLEVGLNADQIKSGLASFGGVKRRFEYYLKTDHAVFIDDYAHHPTEISACLKSVRALYPNRKLTVAFQPHLFSRTNDFHQEFAQSLDLADTVYLLDIYPARELPMPGVTSAIIAKYMQKATVIPCNKANLVQQIQEAKPELLVTVGAGDIDTLLAELKRVLE